MTEFPLTVQVVAILALIATNPAKDGVAEEDVVLVLPVVLLVALVVLSKY